MIKGMKVFIGKPLLFVVIIIVVSFLYWFLRDDQHSQYENLKLSGSLESLTFWYASRAYPDSDIPERAHYAAFKESKKIQQRVQLEKSYSVEPWYTLGPHNQAGRTLAIAINPQNPNTIYAGSASGGLWCSHSGGRGASAWERVETGFPVLGVSSIAVVPDDSNTIYIGTGEVYNYRNTGPNQAFRSRRGTYGMGIFKTTDGGNSWNRSLDWSYNQERGIWAVKINPRNPNTVWAATTEGTYKSTDAGATWLEMHSVIMATDLVINPVDTNIVFISCGDFGSAGYGIYRTKDGGETWTKLTQGLPESFEGKAMLDIYEASPNVVFASIGNGYAINVDNATWLCRSTDSGDTWRILSTQDYTMHQGWYSHDVAVNPDDSSEVYAIGVFMMKSDNGGRNLMDLNYLHGPYTGQTPPEGPYGGPTWAHADFHDIAYHPTDRKIVYFANDGGVWRTTDGGQSFQSCNGGYQTTQFYHGFASSQRNPALAVGGLQDNVTSIYMGSTIWSRWHLLVAFGDGGCNAIDPANDDIIYASNWFLEIYKSWDRGTNWQRIAPPGEGRTVFQAPFVLGNDDPDVIYAGRDIVYRSLNGGWAWHATNEGRPLDGNPVLAMAISQQNSDVVYAATMPYSGICSSVYRTENGGQRWKKITGNLPDRYPMDIAVDPYNHQIIYITYSGFGTSHVFKSIDGGQNWQDIGSGLPDVPTSAVIVDPSFPDHVYVGNDITVYVSTDGGNSWSEYNEGLSEAMYIVDLSIFRPGRKIRVVTHGNGVFERDLLGANQVTVHDSGLTVSDFSLEQNYPNPFNSTTIIHYTLERPSRVTLSIFNSRGQRIRTLISNESMNAGKKIVRWYGKDDTGDRVSSGIYVYKLVAGEFTCSRKLIFVK